MVFIGTGLGIYCEQGAHGTSVYAGWGIPMVPGHEGSGVVEAVGAAVTELREGDHVGSLGLGRHHRGQILEIHLVHDAGARGDHAEILE